MSKARGIRADIQSPRTKLLYFIYSSQNSRIKAEPGVKSNICSALGDRSDGHFHYDWNYLVSAGMIEEKQGNYIVTDKGKKEFALQSTASRSNSVMVFLGIAIIALTVGLELNVVPILSLTFFGIALIIIGTVFLLVDKRNRPALPPEAKVLLKELNH